MSFGVGFLVGFFFWGVSFVACWDFGVVVVDMDWQCVGLYLAQVVAC